MKLRRLKKVASRLGSLMGRRRGITQPTELNSRLNTKSTRDYPQTSDPNYWQKTNPPHHGEIKPGWWCPGEPDHDGPCPLWPLPQRGEQHPHCDTRVLHAPGECKYCDKYGNWQALRNLMGINFSGHNDPDKAPCPADQAVADGTRGDYNLWGGNRPHNGPEIYKF